MKGQNAQLRSTLGQAQRALLGNISDALAAVNAAQNAFDQSKTPPQLGSDPVNVLAVVELTVVKLICITVVISARGKETVQCLCPLKIVLESFDSSDCLWNCCSCCPHNSDAISWVTLTLSSL